MSVAFFTLGQECSFLESAGSYYLDICFTDSKILFCPPPPILFVLVGIFLKKKTPQVFFSPISGILREAESQRMCPVAE